MHNYSESILMVLGVSAVESMGFKLFKSVLDVLIASLVVVIDLGENLRYDTNTNNALLP